MSTDADDDEFDDLDEPEEGVEGCWIYTAVVGITTPEGACTIDPSVEIECVFDHFPNEDERAGCVLDEAADWLDYFLMFDYFTDRFGKNPSLCIVGDSIVRC